jgi:transcriptional regulator with XRE-family HTH domain
MAVADELPALTMRVARTLRSHREARGLSITQTAARAGLSKTILATIETGAGNPSLETLWRIARALDVTLGTLLGDDDDPLRTRVIRYADSELVESESGMRSRLVYGDGRGRRVETLEMELESRMAYPSAPHAPGTEELVVCLIGSMVVGPDGQEVTLSARDALHFRADVPHGYRSDEGCRAICIISYPAAP